MKNTIKHLLLFSLLWGTAGSYAQSYQWGKSGGGQSTVDNDGYEQVTEMTTDTQGNVYGISKVTKTVLTIDGHPKTGWGQNAGTPNGALFSFDCAGNYRWSKIFGGFGGAEILSVKTDLQDNVYVLGYANLDFNIDTYHRPCTTPFINGIQYFNDCKRFFIAKFSSQGEVVWITYPDDMTSYVPNNCSKYNSTGYPYDMDIDPQGNLYILCYLFNGTFFNGAYVNNQVGTPAQQSYELGTPCDPIMYSTYHVLKINSQGQFVSGTPIDLPVAAYQVRYLKMVRDQINNRYYVCYYKDSFNSFDIGGSPSGSQVVVAYDAQGTLLWKVQDTTTTSNPETVPTTSGLRDLALDNEGNIYVSGLTWCKYAGIQLSTSFGGMPYYTDLDCPTASLPFIAKINPQGQVVWFSNPRYANNVGSDEKGIVINGNEVAQPNGIFKVKWDDIDIQTPYIYINAGIYRLNKETGALINIDMVAATPNAGSGGTSITADHLGNYYLGGELVGYGLQVGSSNLSSNGSNPDFLVAKFGTDNCNCQVPVCRFKPIVGAGNVVSFEYQGQQVYSSTSWNFGDGTTSTEVNPQHTYATPGSYNVCLTATNNCDSFTFCKLVDTTALGTETFIENVTANIELSPNPASEMVTINFDSKKEIPTLELYDVSGRLMAHYEPTHLTGTWQIPLETYAKGLYLVVLKHNGKVQMQKKLLVK